MEPVVINMGGEHRAGLPCDQVEVANRIVTIVRERFPRAEIADIGPFAGSVLAGYPAAAGVNGATAEEIDAASRAAQRGATHLLVPAITEWTEMRTDDPIGALILPHNSVTMPLRLMCLAPPALAGQVTFHNRARLTLNQKAGGLLNDRFREAVLQLLSGPATAAAG